MLLLGSSADTNNGEASMRNLVLLDIRNIASENALEYYNGADSQADAAKDMSQFWIQQRGYPGPFPLPGSQVAILDGASNDFTTHAMIKANIGEVTSWLRSCTMDSSGRARTSW
jgi:hypothetical protein